MAIKVNNVVVGAVYTKNSAVNGVGFFDFNGNVLSHTGGSTFTIPENTAFLFAVFTSINETETNILLIKTNAA